MAEADVTVGSMWYRGQNHHPMRVLAVVEGFVVYRFRKYRPGVVPVDEWLSAFRLASRAPVVEATSTAPRVRRSR